jgi:hypothetical protein
MPRQLKINIDANYNPSAPTTINFTTPLIIEPGNKIAMDKFSAVIKDITVDFDLPESIFTLYYSLTSINNQSAPITLPSKHYDTLAELLNLMTTNSNSAFSGYVANMLPALSTGDFSYYRDRGLKMLASAATGNKFSFEYVTCPFSVLAVGETNMNADTSGNWYPSTANTIWTITQTDEQIVLTRGGGCMLEFNINFPTQAEAIANGIATSIGLFDKNGFSLGLLQRASSGVLFLYDINNVQTYRKALYLVTLDKS